MFFLFVLDLVQNDIRQAFTRLCEIIDVESFFIYSYTVFVIVFLFYGAFPLSELGSHIHSKQNMI